MGCRVGVYRCSHVTPGTISFAEFQKYVNDTEFLEQLEEAKRDPKGETARKLVQKVLRFINLAAQKIPWGSQERAGEMTKLMADHRAEMVARRAKETESKLPHWLRSQVAPGETPRRTYTALCISEMELVKRQRAIMERKLQREAREKQAINP